MKIEPDINGHQGAVENDVDAFAPRRDENKDRQAEHIEMETGGPAVGQGAQTAVQYDRPHPQAESPLVTVAPVQEEAECVEGDQKQIQPERNRRAQDPIYRRENAVAYQGENKYQIADNDIAVMTRREVLGDAAEHYVF